MLFTKILKYWVPLIIWMGLIFVASSGLFSLSAESTEEVIRGEWNIIIRHLAHVGEYFVLFILFYRAVNRGIQPKKYPFSLTAFLGSFMYSVSDEVHQHYVPGRHCRLIDVGYNTIGIIIGIAFIYFVCKYMERQGKEKSV